MTILCVWQDDEDTDHAVKRQAVSNSESEGSSSSGSSNSHPLPGRTAGSDGDGDVDAPTTVSVTTIYASRGEVLPQQYAGDATYASATEQNKHVSGAKSGSTMAPLRAPAFLRATCRFDYQPDICKDYKETGFCGYGDQCKFMHDRSDYKSGWQMEKEWDEAQKKKKQALEAAMKTMGDGTAGEDNQAGAGGDSDSDSEPEEEELPFACFICREKFNVNPVVTLCNHYFCYSCISDNHGKGGGAGGKGKCPVCGKATDGVFNRATKIIKRIKAEKDLELSSGGGVNKVAVATKVSSWDIVQE